ncbi:MAG TPA: hypothetical protein VJC03_05040 [bacterium]|nr:hypothetical protein [bacterium]
MKHERNSSIMPVLLFSISFLVCSASITFSMSADDVERKVTQLFVQSELIPHVSITPAEKGRFVIELTYSIGDRWGRDGFVRELARAAITKVFTSSLPLAQGIIKVYCSHTEAIHLAIGINQAKQILWEDSLNSSQFFDMLRSWVRWGKRPEDRTYFIEHRQTIKPSPVVSLPPDS